jgi:UTP-glucose-1-phosphate uridylyltransferase
MGRIVIPSGGDLSNSFRTALNTLAGAGIQMQPGTKLVTRYAVIVLDEAALDDAVAQLLKAGIKAQKDAP